MVFFFFSKYMNFLNLETIAPSYEHWDITVNKRGSQCAFGGISKVALIRRQCGSFWCFARQHISFSLGVSTTRFLYKTFHDGVRDQAVLCLFVSEKEPGRYSSISLCWQVQEVQDSMAVTSFNPWIPLVDVRASLVLRAFGFFELFCSPLYCRSTTQAIVTLIIWITLTMHTPLKYDTLISITFWLVRRG